MVLIKMPKKIKKVLKKHRNFVRIFANNKFILIHSIILVNSFVEEEIKNGISAERIVSKD